MDAGGRTTQEQLSTTAWMQEVESHARAQGDKADDCMDESERSASMKIGDHLHENPLLIRVKQLSFRG